MPSPPPARRPKNPNVHHGDTETRRAHGENGVDQTLAAPVLPGRSELETSKRNLTATTDGHDPLTETTIGAAIEVHRALGPGLLEFAYQECLVIVLRDRGPSVARQVELPIECPRTHRQTRLSHRRGGEPAGHRGGQGGRVDPARARGPTPDLSSALAKTHRAAHQFLCAHAQGRRPASSALAPSHFSRANLGCVPPPCLLLGASSVTL